MRDENRAGSVMPFLRNSCFGHNVGRSTGDRQGDLMRFTALLLIGTSAAAVASQAAAQTAQETSAQAANPSSAAPRPGNDMEEIIVIAVSGASTAQLLPVS